MNMARLLKTKKKPIHRELSSLVSGPPFIYPELGFTGELTTKITSTINQKKLNLIHLLNDSSEINNANIEATKILINTNNDGTRKDLS
jgi:hypothetical protein